MEVLIQLRGLVRLLKTQAVSNNAVGGLALGSCNGSENTAIGHSAGGNLTTGDGNVYVGAGIQGVADEANHTYIRNINTTPVSGGGTDTVTIDLTTGLVGHASSSRRYKEDIQPMDDASQALFRLKPVSFRYKKEIDQSHSLDYGLIAEEVAKVDSNLAIRDKNGQIESVRYSAINAMLLNEFLKEHTTVQEQATMIARLNSTVEKQERTAAQQAKEIQALTVSLKEQASQIQKVSAQVEMSKPAIQTAGNQR